MAAAIILLIKTFLFWHKFHQLFKWQKTLENLKINIKIHYIQSSNDVK